MRAVSVAWLLVVLAAVLIAVRYDALPDPLPVLRSPMGEVRLAMPLTWPIAMRVVALGAGTLLAASGMALASRDAPAWRSLFDVGAVAIGAKALCEAASLASPWPRAFDVATLIVVGTFLAFAFRTWRRGLGPAPRVHGAARALVLGGLVTWAGALLLPLVG